MNPHQLPSSASTARIFIKAIILLFILNLVCLGLNFKPIAALTQFNTWWLVGHGRSRLVSKSDFQNGQLPIDSLLATHEIAYNQKKPEEYRVVVLGDSTAWGQGLLDEETFSGQLTAANLVASGKHIVAYNLGYPSADIIAMMITLDAAMKYQPDLIIWFVTAYSFNNDATGVTTNEFASLNHARLEQLAETYHMQSWLDSRMPPEPAWRKYFAFYDQGTVAVWLGSLFYPFVPTDVGNTGRRVATEPVTAKSTDPKDVPPGFYPMPNESWNFVTIGQELATRSNAKLLLINEPTLVLRNNPNAATTYSNIYARAYYNYYREAFSDYCTTHRIWCVDLWDVVPPADFMDSERHFDGNGWSLTVNRVIDTLRTRLVIDANSDAF